MILLTHPDNIDYLKSQFGRLKDCDPDLLGFHTLSAVGIQIRSLPLMNKTTKVVKFPDWPLVEFGKEDEEWARKVGWEVETPLFIKVHEPAFGANLFLGDWPQPKWPWKF